MTDDSRRRRAAKKERRREERRRACRMDEMLEQWERERRATATSGDGAPTPAPTPPTEAMSGGDAPTSAPTPPMTVSAAAVAALMAEMAAAAIAPEKATMGTVPTTMTVADDRRATAPTPPTVTTEGVASGGGSGASGGIIKVGTFSGVDEEPWDVFFSRFSPPEMAGGEYPPGERGDRHRAGAPGTPRGAVRDRRWGDRQSSGPDESAQGRWGELARVRSSAPTLGPPGNARLRGGPDREVVNAAATPGDAGGTPSLRSGPRVCHLRGHRRSRGRVRPGRPLWRAAPKAYHGPGPGAGEGGESRGIAGGRRCPDSSRRPGEHGCTGNAGDHPAAPGAPSVWGPAKDRARRDAG
ncbi:PREDICTED: collagen alpha-1(I) chain-like [Priapulus caudatus]|uniref:Collagen alpha-1(I) chain-like n=1 Tax=Priapulus caudatus TaxID=37621 RepID=A0ABM1E5V3_PRICU|nr:PREDICTED: collagen alpha-1(I) chain-like [Priapulus caudatus]